MYELITLGIAETYPNTDEFTVLAIVVGKNNIISLDLKKEDIISETGEVFWDIAFSTYVDELKRSPGPNGNFSYIPYGVKLGENKSLELKKILDLLSENIDIFIENTKYKYAVAKATSISDITLSIDRKGIRKYKITSVIKKLPIYKNPLTILVKDYRWVKYWNWVLENSMFEEKKKKYTTLLNRKDKTIYFILYRHYYSDNIVYWISGMHWL